MTSAILTDEQIVACLSYAGDRQAMLQAAARMGMMRAAEICEQNRLSDNTGEHGKAWNAGVDTAQIAIRAAAEASPPPREPKDG